MDSIVSFNCAVCSVYTFVCTVCIAKFSNKDNIYANNSYRNYCYLTTNEMALITVTNIDMTTASRQSLAICLGYLPYSRTGSEYH